MFSVNKDEFGRWFMAEVNAELTKEAEPFIQQALKDYEKLLRERLTAKLLSRIERNYSVENFGDIIRFEIKQYRENDVHD